MAKATPSSSAFMAVSPKNPSQAYCGRPAASTVTAVTEMALRDCREHGEAARATAQDLIGSCPYGDRTEQ
jgi:hypothetical protein